MDIFEKNVLILGGNGFLGRNLTDELLKKNCNITCFDFSLGDHSSDVRYISGDFIHTDNFDELVEGQDIVFHLISTTMPNSSVTFETEAQDNIISSIRLFESCVKYGARLIFISSGGTVYGNNGMDINSEDSPTMPYCSYAVQKLCIEKYLEVYGHQKGLDYKIARLANPYGPYQRTNSGMGVISTFIERSLTTGEIDLFGEGDTVRDYIYVGDAVRALVTIAGHDGCVNLFNVGSGEGHTLLDVIKRIEAVSGRKFKINRVPMRKSDINKNVLDITRLKCEFPDLKFTGFDEGIREYYLYKKELLGK